MLGSPGQSRPAQDTDVVGIIAVAIGRTANSRADEGQPLRPVQSGRYRDNSYPR
jgi:hypothetical protein